MMKHEEITGNILKSAFEVAHELGSGFLESVYEKSMLYAMKDNGLRALAQCPVDVKYKGVIVGTFYCDLLVENCVIIELKAVKAIMPEHQAQLINYLKATGLEVGLLINFGKQKIEYYRMYNHPRETEL